MSKVAGRKKQGSGSDFSAGDGTEAMKLTGPQGDFELNIVDYEYSDAGDFLNRNWLIVSIVTTKNRQQSTRTLTYLSTWELELLHDWMQSVADEAELAPQLTFIDPSLRFCNLSDGRQCHSFRIGMANDALPNWHEDQTRTYWLLVTPAKDELKRAIQDLADQLSKFPVRV